MSAQRFFNRRLLVVLLAGTAVLCAGCKGKEDLRTKQKTPEKVPVMVSRVALQAFSYFINYAGDIKAQDEVAVYPKVSGKISEKIKEDGAAVAKGDVLLYIDRDETGLKFEKAPVESPLTGVVGRIYVDRGQNVTAQTAVALVVNMENVKINLDVPEKYLPQVALGQQAFIAVDAYPQEEFSGTVTKASPVVDTTTRTAPIEITIANPEHRLKPGMFARVRLVLKDLQRVPVVLRESVIGKDPDTYVYTVKDGKAVLQKVVLGIRKGAYYEVKEGLSEGDMVVIMGQQKLTEGALVLVEEEGKK
ncbi:MAG: efflux RND transporter periplasmic adaptor subunit [Candidatus Omnitrophica bacterium]|nr:efflux RND transporter periplasmic adaptor subunit [Candidatus Omnitrophota bacterium]